MTWRDSLDGVAGPLLEPLERPVKVCPDCDGWGSIADIVCDFDDGPDTEEQRECHRCSGTGREAA